MKHIWDYNVTVTLTDKKTGKKLIGDFDGEAIAPLLGLHGLHDVDAMKEVVNALIDNENLTEKEDE
jgi:hypothetical protein